MTIEQYYSDKKPAPAATSTGEKLERSAKISTHDESITIPTVLYTELIRQSALYEAVINIMTNKRLEYDRERCTGIAVVLDLPYEEGGES